MQLPRGGTLTLRRVTPDDDDFLLSVYDSTRAAELDQVQWAEGQREAFLKWQFDLQRAEYKTRFPDAQYDVIVIDGTPAGRMWIGRTAEEIRDSIAGHCAVAAVPKPRRGHDLNPAAHRGSEIYR
jgi:hypothetical protein